MASSEALVSNHQRPELPQFTLHVCTRVPHSVPRRIARLLLIVTSSHMLPSPALHWLGIRFTTKNRFTVACLTRLQVSLYATARRACSPCTGQDFYFRAFVPVIAHRNVEYDYMGIQSIPMAGLSPARHAALWAAYKSEHKKTQKMWSLELPVLFVSLRVPLVFSSRSVRQSPLHSFAAPRLRNLTRTTSSGLPALGATAPDATPRCGLPA